MTIAIPESLVNPRVIEDSPSQTAEQIRRAVSGAVATTAAPTSATPGFNTRNHQFLHMTALCRVSDSFDVTLWGKTKVSGVWAIMGWIGTAGVVQATFPNGAAMIEPALIAGIDSVYPQITARVGGSVADVWLAGSSFG